MFGYCFTHRTKMFRAVCRSLERTLRETKGEIFECDASRDRRAGSPLVVFTIRSVTSFPSEKAARTWCRDLVERLAATLPHQNRLAEPWADINITVLPPVFKNLWDALKQEV